MGCNHIVKDHVSQSAFPLSPYTHYDLAVKLNIGIYIRMGHKKKVPLFLSLVVRLHTHSHLLRSISH